MASLSVARCLCPADAIAGSHRPRGRPAVDPVDPVDPALPNPACYGSNRHSLRLSWANPGDLQSGVGHGIALFPSSCGASSLRRLSAVDCCTLVSLFFFPLLSLPSSLSGRLDLEKPNLELVSCLVLFACPPWNPTPILCFSTHRTLSGMSRFFRSLALCLCLVWCLGK